MIAIPIRYIFFGFEFPRFYFMRNYSKLNEYVKSYKNGNDLEFKDLSISIGQISYDSSNVIFSTNYKYLHRTIYIYSLNNKVPSYEFVNVHNLYGNWYFGIDFFYSDYR